MFVYTPMKYKIPKIITPTEEKSQPYPSDLNTETIMNKTDRKSTKNLGSPQIIKAENRKTETNFKYTKDIFGDLIPENNNISSERVQLISEEDQRAIHIEPHKSTELIANQILLQKSSRNNQNTNINNKLEELFPKINKEFKDFLRNLLLSENSNLYTVLNSTAIEDRYSKNIFNF